MVSGSFASTARKATTGWSVAYPPGAALDAALRVFLVLHGKNDDHRDAFGSHHLDRFLAGAVRSGVPPFAVAAVDGGSDSYWHSAADFAAHDVLAALSRLSGIPLRVSCGTSDPFIGTTRTLLSRLPAASRDLGPGRHNVAWWEHAAPGQLAFVGKALARAGPSVPGPRRHRRLP